MNFSDILDQWERETAKPYGKKRIKRDDAAGKSASVGETPDADPDADIGDAEKPSRGKSAQGARKQPAELPRANPMDVWLRRYGVDDKDSREESEPARESPAARRKRLRDARPDAVIDLHGLTRDEAWIRLESFFADAMRRGYQKVLIIHGKGSHSVEDPVLRSVVRLFLERNPHAGESGHSEKDSGGTGSTWVILK